MSRWIIVAGLATVLVSLVGLAVLAGSSNAPQDVAAPESSEASDPEPSNPSTSPSTPTTTPSAPAPETTPTEQESDSGQTTQDEEQVQNIRPGDSNAPRTGPRVATIEISGNSTYACSIGRIDSPRTIRGTSPAPFQVRVTPGGSSLDTVMAVCQKISGETLGVRVVYDGELKAQDETSERFGTVSASWSPVQENG